MGQPSIPNLEAFIACGMDPKTGLPLKMLEGDVKSQFKVLLRILDEQEFVNRYEWVNLPAEISSQELERMLYYKGQLCIFFAPNVGEGKFFVTPFALDGGIDFYGRYNSIKPVPMANGFEQDELRKVADNALLTALRFKPLYVPIDKPSKEDMRGKCVIIRDYTQQLSQTILSRQSIQEAIIDVEAECVPYLKTNMLASCGTKAVRVANADQANEIKSASTAIKRNALNGETMTPVKGELEMQNLNDGPVAKCEEFMLCMQSIDNLRLRFLGIKSGGVFEKKAHTLESENSLNEGVSSMSLEDGLAIRKRVCMICNSLWGIGIDVKVKDCLKNMQADDVTVDTRKEGGTGNVSSNDSEV